MHKRTMKKDKQWCIVPVLVVKVILDKYCNTVPQVKPVMKRDYEPFLKRP